MNVFKVNHTVKMKFFSIILLLSLIIVLSGCTVATTPVEPDESIEKTQVAKPEVTPPEEKPVTVVPAEPKPTQPAPKEGTTNQIPVTLVSTTDGDTIRIMYNGKNEPVRYLLIDTPETNHPRLGKQPFGDEAKERNRELVNSGDLTIEFDIGEKRDKYDRLLALCLRGRKKRS